MIVSLFSLIVARGAEVPVVDPRLTSHVDFTSRVDTPDQGPAAQAESEPVHVRIEHLSPRRENSQQLQINQTIDGESARKHLHTTLSTAKLILLLVRIALTSLLS